MDEELFFFFQEKKKLKRLFSSIGVNNLLKVSPDKIREGKQTHQLSYPIITSFLGAAHAPCRCHFDYFEKTVPLQDSHPRHSKQGKGRAASPPLSAPRSMSLFPNEK